MPIIDLALIVASGLAAGFINAVSGGGAVLTVPALIFIGLPPGVANGTNRVAVVVQNVAALAAYQRLRVTDHRMGLALALPATLGSLGGALVSIRLNDAQFRTILVHLQETCWGIRLSSIRPEQCRGLIYQALGWVR
ncbi:MAG: sulfite exporter TauE/SafE family protein [Deltaproteobacteria bacterium]|nr:sulfite exporter TauE/SafE family protein [Deltaproteobacteria bacterium]